MFYLFYFLSLSLILFRSLLHLPGQKLTEADGPKEEDKSDSLTY